jgi:acetylornithine deacetylase/succinyl-diaminopimelate desuccinylase-like protein
MALEEVHRTIEVDFPAHLGSVQEFLRQPSISADGTGISETAGMVQGFIEDLGGEAELVPTGGHPLVYGELMLGKPKTLLVLGSYDVVPVEGEDWIVPPFSGEIAELPDLGPCLVSRGVYDTKGPLRAFINAVTSIQKADELPLNLKFVIEGSEEQGSVGLADFVSRWSDRLEGDAVLLPFFTIDRRGRSATRLGCKGILPLELVCRGGEWGGPRTRGIHSSHGAWISSPLWKLVHALRSMVGEGESINIDGLCDDLRGPDAEDGELLAELDAIFDETKIFEETDVARFKYDDLHGAALLEKYLFSPVINIDGLKGGHTGSGVKTVIGHEARAKLDIRLVPDMTVETTLQRVQDHLARHGFEDLRIDVLGGLEWSRTSVKEPVVRALLESYRQHGYEAEVWPTSSGSGIFGLFTRELGIPLVPGGLCHGGNPHSANEYAVAAQIQLFEESMATFLYTFAAEEAGDAIASRDRVGA